MLLHKTLLRPAQAAQAMVKWVYGTESSMLHRINIKAKDLRCLLYCSWIKQGETEYYSSQYSGGM